MLKELLNQIIPIISAAGVSVGIVMIKTVGDAAVKLIETKIKEVATKIGTDKYNYIKTVALDIWNIVEEKFRLSDIVGKVTDQKIAEFNKLIKSKIPSITDAEIEEVRQAIAGEVNKGKKALSEDVTALQSKVTDLTNSNTTLTNENATLKNTISTIQSAAKTVEITA